MRDERLTIPARSGGVIDAYIVHPVSPPLGTIIALMEIWGANDVMETHAKEFASAGYLCVVPDLHWRKAPGRLLSESNPADIETAFDLYAGLDFDTCVEDIDDVRCHVTSLAGAPGDVGAVGYGLGGQLCVLLSSRTSIRCATAYYGSCSERELRELSSLRCPLQFHMAAEDRWVGPTINRRLRQALCPLPLVEFHEYSGADHAFARYGSPSYSAAAADKALERSIALFDWHLAMLGND